MITIIEKIGKLVETSGLGTIGFSIIWIIFFEVTEGFSILGWGIMIYSFGMLIKTIMQLINYFR
jgi:hypothetical protein